MIFNIFVVFHSVFLHVGEMRQERLRKMRERERGRKCKRDREKERGWERDKKREIAGEREKETEEDREKEREAEGERKFHLQMLHAFFFKQRLYKIAKV